MSEYSEFFLSSKSSVVQLELLEIMHPNFTKTYRVVRNAVDGVTVNLRDHGKNLFNPSDSNVAPGHFINFENGNIVENATYTATGFVPVLPGKTYTVSFSHSRAFYNRDGQYISGVSSGNPATFVTPVNAFLARFTVETNLIKTFQIEEGSKSTEFYPYGIADFSYYPLRITGIGTRDNLDFGLKIDIGDLGEVLPKELDAVSSANNYAFKPIVKYRTFRSDDLTQPLFGPFALEVKSFSFNRDGATFEAKAPSLNVNSTGEIYTIDRFPMLRGFL